MSRKTIVITGCSSGFGRVTALELARRGWHVYGTARKESDCDELRAEAAKLQGPQCAERITCILCDITKSEQVADLQRQVSEATPHLDALLNNAGTAFASPLELLSLDDLRAQLEINVVAHLAVIQALLPLLKVARGTIINVSSVNGRIVTPALGAYAASKFALEGLSDALRLELIPFGVRVVVIQPGSSSTTIWNTGLQRAQATLEQHRRGPYARLLNRVERMGQRASSDGFPPQLFADTIVKILSSSHPRSRYPVPFSAGVQLALRYLLPDALWDPLIRRMFRW